MLCLYKAYSGKEQSVFFPDLRGVSQLQMMDGDCTEILEYDGKTAFTSVQRLFLYCLYLISSNNSNSNLLYFLQKHSAFPDLSQF
jgi:hypothetical protein